MDSIKVLAAVSSPVKVRDSFWKVGDPANAPALRILEIIFHGEGDRVWTFGQQFPTGHKRGFPGDNIEPGAGFFVGLGPVEDLLPIRV